MNSAHINWHDRQPGLSLYWGGAVMYADFIKDWVTIQAIAKQ